MSASEMPAKTMRDFRSRAYAPASSAERRSGRLTTSMSGTPARLKSTPLLSSAPGKPVWMSLPASSSSCTRWMPIRRGWRSSPPSGPSARMESQPFLAIGRSNWVIWYPFGRSG